MNVQLLEDTRMWNNLSILQALYVSVKSLIIKFGLYLFDVAYDILIEFVSLLIQCLMVQLVVTIVTYILYLFMSTDPMILICRYNNIHTSENNLIDFFT